MFEFIITSEEERKLLDAVNLHFNLKNSENVLITDKIGIEAQENNPKSQFSFFLSTFKYQAEYYYNDDLNYSELESSICVCNYQESLKHLNSIRSENPLLSFQFIYFIASIYPEELFQFLSDIKARHTIPSIGIINHFNQKNLNIEGLDYFLSFSDLKKRTSLVVVSSKDNMTKKETKFSNIIFRRNESEKIFLNVMYYRKVNWRLYEPLLEVYNQFNDEMREAREDEKFEESFLETPDFEILGLALGEMNDNEFELFLDRMNKDEIDSDIEETDSFYW